MRCNLVARLGLEVADGREIGRKGSIRDGGSGKQDGCEKASGDVVERVCGTTDVWQASMAAEGCAGNSRLI